jgi:hypothetical protein
MNDKNKEKKQIMGSLPKPFVLYYSPSPSSSLSESQLPFSQPLSQSFALSPLPEAQPDEEPSFVDQHVVTGYPNSHGSINTQTSIREIEPRKYQSNKTSLYKEIFWEKHENKDKAILNYMTAKGQSTYALNDFWQIDQIICGTLRTVEEIKPVVDACYQLLLSIILDLTKKKNISALSDKVFTLLVYASLEEKNQKINFSFFCGDSFTFLKKEEFLQVGCQVKSLDAIVLRHLLSRKDLNNDQKILKYDYLLTIASDIVSGNKLKIASVNDALVFDFPFILSLVLDIYFSNNPSALAKVSGKVFFALADFATKNKLVISRSIFNANHALDVGKFMAIALEKHCLLAYEEVYNKTRPVDALMALCYLEKSAAIFFNKSDGVRRKNANIPAAYSEFIVKLIEKRRSCYKGVSRQIRNNTLNASKLFQLAVNERVAQSSLVLQGIVHSIKNFSLLLDYVPLEKNLLRVIDQFFSEFEKHVIPLVPHEANLFSSLREKLNEVKRLLDDYKLSSASEVVVASNTVARPF